MLIRWTQIIRRRLPSVRALNRVLLFFLISCLSIPVFSQKQISISQELNQAEKLVASGQYKEATQIYRSLLDQEPSPSDYAQLLKKALSIQQSVDDVLELIDRYVGRVGDPAEQTVFHGYRRILLEMTGRIDAALQSGEDSADMDDYNRAVLYFEMGLFSDAEATIRKVVSDERRELRAKATLLLANIQTAQGKRSEAEALYLLLITRYGDSKSMPAILLAYIGYLLGENRREKAGEQLLRLADYPDSPEYAIARGWQQSGESSVISRTLSPALLLKMDLEGASPATSAEADASASDGEGPGPENVTPTTADEAEPSAPPVPEEPNTLVLVQTGSFQDPENAQYMVRDLGDFSFKASVLETIISGETYHRVVIGPPRSPERAQDLLLQLKEAGFEGFFLIVEGDP